MSNVLTSSWFYWAVGVAVGLPVGLILLTEWQRALVRRKSFLAKPVGLLRNYLLPLGALLLLLIKATEIPTQETPVKVVATLFGFVVMVLSALLIYRYLGQLGRDQVRAMQQEGRLSVTGLVGRIAARFRPPAPPSGE